MAEAEWPESLQLRSPTPTNADAILKYRPQGDTLRAFHNADDFVRCIIGPLGSGKTQAMICEIFSRCHEQPPDRNGRRRSQWAVVRNTYVDLTSTTIRDFRRVIDPLNVGSFRGGANPMYTLNYRRRDGTEVHAEIDFLAFDREDDVRKIRGLQLTGCWCNELKELNKAVVDMLLGRLGRYPAIVDVPKYWTGLIGDSNAPDGDHWLGQMAISAQQGREVDEWKIFIQPGAVTRINGQWILNQNAENLANLQPDYYKRQLANKKEDWIRANLGNEFILVVDGRPVHPDFSQTMHVAGVELEPAPGRPLVCGIDFGRTPAAVILQKQYNARWLVLNELVTTNMGAKRFGQVLRNWLNEEYPHFKIDFYGDPAGSQMSQADDVTPFMMLEHSDIYAFPCASNDFEIRTECLDTPLRLLIEGEPAILFDPKCKMVIAGLAGKYNFRRIKVAGDERYEDKPNKNAWSHPVEALHYGLYGAGEGDSLFDGSGWGKDLQTIESEDDFEGWHPNNTGIEGY